METEKTSQVTSEQVEGNSQGTNEKPEEDTVVKSVTPSESVAIDINALGSQKVPVDEDEDEFDDEDDDQKEVSGLIANHNFRLIMAIIVTLISAGFFWWLLS